MKSNRTPNLATLVKLHSQHLSFHNYLDRLVLKHDNLDTIDLLIEVKRVNMSCLSRYADLISSKTISLHSNNPINFPDNKKMEETDMTLWNIHGQLARLIPVYQAAMRHKDLNKVTRMVVSLNYDQLINIKENLLHPLPAQVAVR